jgi:hypothetical protein
MIDEQDYYQKPSPVWKLATTISIVEASLLVLDIEPQGVTSTIDVVSDDAKPEGYLAARDAIAAAVKDQQLVGELVKTAEQKTDHHASIVEVLSLASWLDKRNYQSPIFAEIRSNNRAFLDENHPHYSPKLAAAVHAWEAMDEPSAHPGTVKQQLEKWLRLHASRFNLVREDGSPSDLVIEQVAKVSNWATGGGAPKKTVANTDQQ